MNSKDILEKMVNAASALTVDELKTEIKKSMSDNTYGSTYVFSALLDALKLKLSESDYIDFCKSL